MAIVTLTQGAGQAYTNLQALWITGTLKARLISFCSALIAAPDLFPEEQLDFHPISNWCAIIEAISSQMVVNMASPVIGKGVSYIQLNSAVNAVYRMMWMSEALSEDGVITISQVNAIIAAYNASFF